MKTKGVILTIAIIAGAATTADAQGRGRARGTAAVPPGQHPPAGMCRIWINGVPPGRQPAPTDCETAVRNQPANSQIIWGENSRRGRNVADSDRPKRGPTRTGAGGAMRGCGLGTGRTAATPGSEGIGVGSSGTTRGWGTGTIGGVRVMVGAGLG